MGACFSRRAREGVDIFGGGGGCLVMDYGLEGCAEYDDVRVYLVIPLYTVSYTCVSSYMWSLSTPQVIVEAPHPRSGLPFDRNTEQEGAETCEICFRKPL